jgi:sporulation protein YlmC with PRC-barrel domain
MWKTLTITAAATVLAVGAAAAQSTKPSPSPGASPPAASQGAPAQPAEKTPDTSKPAAATGSAKFINAQKADQHLASSFKGTNVVGADNEKIGDISDILFDKNGKIDAYVVSVGGFLGIGAKAVAIEPAAFEVIAGDRSKNQSDKLKLPMSKDQLKQAASFEPYRPPQATTGAGGTSPRPGPGGLPR